MPASEARPTGSASVGPGLRSGDRILSINGRKPNSFNDLVMASAMSRRDEAMQIRVARPGVAEPIDFEIRPKMGQQSRLLEIGVLPAFTGRLVTGKTAQETDELRKVFAKVGLEGVEPGMTLVRVGENKSVSSAADLESAVRSSGGAPVEAEFAGADGRRVTVAIRPRAALQVGRVALPSGSQTTVSHLLGLTPILKVEPREDEKGQQGLQGGDMFARVGEVEFPSIASGIAEVRRHEGHTVEVEVLRKSEGGALERTRIRPDPKVDAQGHIGFYAGDAADESTILALPVPMAEAEGGDARATPAAAIINEPGMRVVSVAGTPVSNFTELRAALRGATEPARKAGTGASVAMTFELPAPPQAGGGKPRRDAEWKLSEADVRTLHDLGWDNPISLSFFEPEEVLLRAEGPNFLARAGSAVGMGLGETKRVMVMTYATFARLFEGTVKVEHLKGPVGIAHMGTRIAEKGMIWLLFFMGLISVNLAVVNFLPLPIVDGGQFLFLVLEKIRGRPLSIEVQNIATVAGLLLIGTMFVIVTFHDIANLF
jgi:regulator of sigma E protease